MKILLPLCLFCSFVFCTYQLSAQPGGGGGLHMSFFNSKLDSIHLDADTAFHIRTFVLDGDKIYQETFLREVLPKDRPSEQGWRISQDLYLPPGREIFGPDGSDQRVCIVYKSDTMVIDFIGVSSGNPAGYPGGIDSVVIKKGYFRHYPAKKWEEEGAYRQVIRNGITPYAMQQLIPAGLMQYNPAIDISFLKEEKLPPAYFFKLAQHYSEKKKTEQALAAMRKGIAKKDRVKTCHDYRLLSYAYEQVQEYEKAIAAISWVIDSCDRIADARLHNEYTNGWDHRSRIELLTKLKQFDKALQGYDTFQATAADKDAVSVERSVYKMEALNDPAAAAAELRATINRIPPNHMSDRLQGTSEYVDQYFLLGIAEYKAGEKQKALKHWLKAMEFGYGYTSGDYAVVHFDSMVKVNPRVPELYLCLALAHHHTAGFAGGGASTKQHYQSALDNINKAAALGMNNYRINMYRAVTLDQLGKYKEALKEIDKAIKKNKTDPRCFSTRFDIRNHLGKAHKYATLDRDHIKYRQLADEWVWEDY